MSLLITNRVTDKQIQMLKDLDYVGKWDISRDEAAEIITALLEERRLEIDKEEQSWD